MKIITGIMIIIIVIILFKIFDIIKRLLKSYKSKLPHFETDEEKKNLLNKILKQKMHKKLNGNQYVIDKKEIEDAISLYKKIIK